MGRFVNAMNPFSSAYRTRRAFPLTFSTDPSGDTRPRRRRLGNPPNDRIPVVVLFPRPRNWPGGSSRSNLSASPVWDRCGKP